MGQVNSVPLTQVIFTAIFTTILLDSDIEDELLRLTRTFKEIASLSYEDFQKCIKSLNKLCKKVTDPSGKQLIFAVEKGTDSTVLWKGTVRIVCFKVDSKTKVIESHRLFNLVQFLKIFQTLECQLTAALQSYRQEMVDSIDRKEESNDSSPNGESKVLLNETNENATSISSTDSEEKPSPKLKNAKIKKFESIFLEEVNSLANNLTDNQVECSICMDRKPDVLLPCAHAYCRPCIEQWNTWNKTCPFCREKLNDTDDTWVISDIPGSQEISQEICSSLMDLTIPK